MRFEIISFKAFEMFLLLYLWPCFDLEIVFFFFSIGNTFSHPFLFPSWCHQADPANFLRSSPLVDQIISVHKGRQWKHSCIFFHLSNDCSAFDFGAKTIRPFDFAIVSVAFQDRIFIPLCLVYMELINSTLSLATLIDNMCWSIDWLLS